MIDLPGYHVRERQFEEDSWSFYKAYSIEKNQMVGIKVNKHQNQELQFAGTVHEYHMTNQLSQQFIMQPIRLEKEGASAYLITHPYSGQTIKAWLKRGKPSIENFLKVSIRIIDALSFIHQEHIIHKSIQSQHILIKPKTNEVKITGFGEATTLTKETQHSYVYSNHFKQQIAYWSPEQTGRMNRLLDYRTDLYSLGVVFYEMLTGVIPFKKASDAEMIHAHLAVTPKSPHEFNQHIPHQLSRITMKLLEKSPEMRYQSIYGLKQDMLKCVNQFQSYQQINPFEVGKQDVSSTLKKSQTLFGRERLLTVFIENVKQFKNGKKRHLFLTGPSGIGKTALVNKIHEECAQDNNYFLWITCSLLESNKPYTPIIRAFQDLFKQLLSEGSERIVYWRETFLRGLSPYEGIIAHFIPEIEFIIGKQDKQEQLPSEAMYQQFLQAILAFMDLFVTRERPLIILLDDLQWADQATIYFMNHLLQNEQHTHLLMIGAYQHSVNHLIDDSMKEVRESDTPSVIHEIKPLKFIDVQLWIEEVFLIDQHDTRVLSEFIYRVTQGHPLLIEQSLQLLYDERIIRFHQDDGIWVLNIDDLQNLTIDSSVTDFIVKRLDQLPCETIKILQIAACLGRRFDLKTLAMLTKESYAEIARKLWFALEKGIIYPLDMNYKWVYPDENITLIHKQSPKYHFLHHKLLKGVYIATDQDTREQLHLQVGKMLLNMYDGEQREEHIFEIVHHLNIASDHLSLHERLSLAKWNRLAGNKAKLNATQAGALIFFEKGQQLLPQNCWDEPYFTTTYQMMLNLGESQFLTKKYIEAEKTFEIIFKHAQTIEEKANVYELKISLYTETYQEEKAIETGIECLLMCRQRMKRKPTKIDVIKEYMLVQLALKKSRKGNLLDLPKMKDKHAQLILKTLVHLNEPAYRVNQNLSAYLTFKALRLSLKYGVMDITSLVYSNYALVLSAGIHNYKEGYAFGKLSLEHASKYEDNNIKAKVYFIFGSLINHLSYHFRSSIDYLEKSQQYSMASGDIHFEGVNTAFIGMIAYLKGENLKTLLLIVKEQLHIAKQSDNQLAIHYLDEMIYWIDVLIHADKYLSWKFIEFTDHPLAILVHHTPRLQMTYLFHEEIEAKKIIEKVRPFVDQVPSLVITPEYFFYDCLWTMKFMKNKGIRFKRGKKKVEQKLKYFKKWAQHSPTNFQHQYKLLQAEFASILGDDQRAVRLYQASISLAKENGFLQDVAIANECMAQYYLDTGLPQSAKGYIFEAYDYYMRWGAQRKADQLIKQYPAFIDQQKKGSIQTYEKNRPLGLRAAFEVAAVLSREVNFKQLVQKIMEAILTQGGGERACLILSQKHELQIVANDHVNKDIHILEERLPVRDFQELPQTIIDYVANRKDYLVLGHASMRGEFIKDKYIASKQVKSILCLPLLNQGKLIGVLYLENNQMTHAFTNERVDLLAILASQAAISIENTYLYSHLEDEVEDRTRLLNKVNKNLMQANGLLAQSREEKRAFFANISHDLRSPIATIRSYIDAILEGIIEDPKKQQHYLQLAKKRLLSLNRLIDDVFELAQLELGNITFSQEVQSIDQLFTHLCSQFELEVAQNQLDYKLKLPENKVSKYPLVEVDIGRMEQVFTNLISNALRYANSFIRISLSIKEDNFALIVIEDDGEGIPVEETQFIFDRFYTKVERNKKQGYGLGLAICKEIITYHKGEIWAESVEGKGTAFFILLPIFNVP